MVVLHDAITEAEKIGAWVIAHTQAQGSGSELQAGARAELIDSPVTRALSTFRGRIATRTMKLMFFGSVAPLLNYAAFRPYAVMQAIRLALGEQSNTPRIVLDPAGGYSPSFYWLAKEMPDTQFVEIDTAKVVETKRYLLRDLSIPANLRLRPLDLSQRNLHDTLIDRVDVLIGIGAYVSHQQYRQFLDYARRILSKDGYIVAAFPYLPGIENFQRNKSLFSRIVTVPKGVVSDIDQLYSVFDNTGFEIKEVIRLSELAAAQNKPMPADIEVIAVAQLKA